MCMSEVTVEAVQPVMNLPVGTVVTVERTPRIIGAIEAGMLRLVDGPAEPEPPAEPAPEPPADKRRRRKDDVVAAVLTEEPAAEPDAPADDDADSPFTVED